MNKKQQFCHAFNAILEYRQAHATTHELVYRNGTFEPWPPSMEFFEGYFQLEGKTVFGISITKYITQHGYTSITPLQASKQYSSLFR